VKNWLKEKGELENNVVHFLKKTLKVFFVKNLIFPLQDANHWSVIVMNIDQLLHYDLLISHNCFPSTMVH
jgi:hypothetical protein